MKQRERMCTECVCFECVRKPICWHLCVVCDERGTVIPLERCPCPEERSDAEGG